jgi:hypothetical protein
MLEIKTYDMEGKGSLLTQVFAEAQPTSVKNYIPIKETIDGLRKEKGMFLSLRLLDKNKKIVSDNFYWLPNSDEKYTGLQQIKTAAATMQAKREGADKIVVIITNPANGPVSFFNRVSLLNPGTKKRILPVFYSDNYVSVLPGETKTITLEYTPDKTNTNLQVSLQGWNTAEQLIEIK